MAKDTGELARLAVAVSEGDARAEEEFFRLARERLRLQATRWVAQEDVEDLVQDALIVVLQRLREGSLTEPAKAMAFAASVARRMAIERHRRSARRRTIADSEAVERAEAHSQVPEDQVFQQELKQWVAGLVGSLSVARDQEVIRLLYLEDADRDNVCEALSVPPRHLSRLAYRSKARLKAVVEAREREMLGFVG